jgi:hypothetical protein
MRPARPINPGMAESEHPTEAAPPARPARVDRHRIATRRAEAVDPAHAVEAPKPAHPPAPVGPAGAEPVAPSAPAEAPESSASAAPVPPAAVEPVAPAAPAEAIEPPAPALAPPPPAPTWRKRSFGPARAPAKDKTTSAVRRPALLSDRCLGCGASTEGRSGMVTELVEVGPIRALRVIACTACPDRRRRALTNS